MKNILKIETALDAAAVQVMRTQLDMLAMQEADLAIDMTGCNFLDSSGVGAIVFLYKRKLAKGYVVSLLGLQGQPLKLLRHLGIAGLLADRSRSAA